jgi:hypothetical protein
MNFIKSERINYQYLVATSPETTKEYKTDIQNNESLYQNEVEAMNFINRNFQSILVFISNKQMKLYLFLKSFH